LPSDSLRLDRGRKKSGAKAARLRYDAHPKHNNTEAPARPMCRPRKESPGGRDRYDGNAASYLEIGDAMAAAMLELLGTEPPHADAPR